MIKFGWRSSLLYPSLFILFIGLRRLIKHILETYVAKGYKFSYLMIILMYICEVIIGIICLCFRKKNNAGRVSKFMGIPMLPELAAVLNRPDGNFKIIILIFFEAFFQFVGAISRRYVTNKSNKDIYDEFHAKYRSSEIIIASLLCYFTLNNKIYKHHIFSLMIIFICLIIVFTVSLVLDDNDNFDDDLLLIYIGVTLVSSTCRAFLDTIEKYLFTVDYADIMKLMIFEGIIDIILSSPLYLFKKPRNEIDRLFDIEGFKYWGVVGLLIIYSIFSGCKNVYRRYTVKEFTPMTRALAESILDPLFIISGFCQNDEAKNWKTWTNFITSLVCSIIMVFCSCIYNEVFVLYCCGLEKNTHLEASYKTTSIELSSDSERSSRIDDYASM